MDIDSDDDPSPEEPAADWDAFLKAQAAARELDMSRRKAEAAQLSQPSAAAASEASWRTAAPPARELLHTEARQLGVQDSLLPDNRVSYPAFHEASLLNGINNLFMAGNITCHACKPSSLRRCPAYAKYT